MSFETLPILSAILLISLCVISMIVFLSRCVPPPAFPPRCGIWFSVFVLFIVHVAVEATVGAVSSGRHLLTDGKVEGLPFQASNLCGTKLWLGDWSELMLCSWSGVDIRLDPFTYSSSGAIRLTALQDCDFLVRNPAAFVMATVGE